MTLKTASGWHFGHSTRAARGASRSLAPRDPSPTDPFGNLHGGAGRARQEGARLNTAPLMPEGDGPTRGPSREHDEMSTWAALGASAAKAHCATRARGASARLLVQHGEGN